MKYLTTIISGTLAAVALASPSCSSKPPASLQEFLEQQQICYGRGESPLEAGMDYSKCIDQSKITRCTEFQIEIRQEGEKYIAVPVTNPIHHLESCPASKTGDNLFKGVPTTL